MGHRTSGIRDQESMPGIVNHVIRIRHQPSGIGDQASGIGDQDAGSVRWVWGISVVGHWVSTLGVDIGDQQSRISDLGQGVGDQASGINSRRSGI